MEWRGAVIQRACMGLRNAVRVVINNVDAQVSCFWLVLQVESCFLCGQAPVFFERCPPTQYHGHC